MNNKKVFALSVILVAVLIIPLISQAQRGGMGGGFGSRSTSTQSEFIPKNDNEKKIYAMLNEMTATQRTQTYIDAVTNNANLDTLFINTGSGSVGMTIKKH